jgi:micrococcal nuclease
VVFVIYTVPAFLIDAYDGDTLHADLDLGWGVWLRKDTIRLARINAPEMGSAEGTAARDFIRGLIAPLIASGKPASFASSGFDKYKRALGEVVIPAGNISDLMLASGHAVPYV